MPAPTSASRARLVGLAAGVVLLLALVGLAVLLPRLEGTDSAPASASAGEAVEVTLPATVPGFTSAGAGDAAAAAQLTERLASAETRLEDLYAVPVSVALYSGDEGAGDQRSAVVTALSAPAGLFLPSGPAPDPGLLELARNQAELVRSGDALCNVVYGAPVPAGQEVDESEVPQGVQCQLTADGVTYQVDGSAMSVDDAAGVLDAVAAAQD